MERLRYFILNHRMATLFLIGAVITVMVFMAWVLPALRNRGKIAVEIAAVPSDAVITLNGQPISAGTIHVAPGQYSLVANKEGFATYETMLDTGHSHYIPVLLAPESNEAQEWATANKEKYTAVEGVAGEQAQNAGDRFYADYPIANNLPYRSLYFNIDYRFPGSHEDTLVLEVNAGSALGRQFAIRQIREWGYEPTDYKIVFTAFDNPLGEASR